MIIRLVIIKNKIFEVTNVDVKKEKVVSIRMKPEDYAKVKRYAESSNKTITQVMQEGVAKLLDEKE